MTLEGLKRFFLPPRDGRVLLISASRRQQNDLTVCSIGQRWRLLVAHNLETGLHLTQQTRIEVVLFDQDLPGTDWRKGVRDLLLQSGACILLLSFAPTDGLSRDILGRGGCGVAAKPMDRESLVRTVNGLFSLLDDIESCRAFNAEPDSTRPRS